MTKYEMEFEEMINRIVSKRIEQELNNLEVRVNGYETTDGIIIHSVVVYNGRCLKSSSGIIPKYHG